MLVLLVLQTFVNDVRIQEQMYITLKLEDKLRFGYDILSPLHPTSQLLHNVTSMWTLNVRLCISVPFIFLTCLSHIPTCSRL